MPMSIQASRASLYLGFPDLWLHEKTFLPVVYQTLYGKSHREPPPPIVLVWEGREWLKIQPYQTSVALHRIMPPFGPQYRQEVSFPLSMISSRLFLEL